MDQKQFNKLNSSLETLKSDIVWIKREVTALKNTVEMIKTDAQHAKVLEELGGLKKQLFNISMAQVECEGKVEYESFNNIILDEIIELARKLSGRAEITERALKSIEEIKEKLDGPVDAEMSLNELKEELLVLVDKVNE